MMIFFNGDTFKLGRLEKKIPIPYTFYESAQNLSKNIIVKVEGMKLDLKNAFLARYQNKYCTVLGISVACICANVF